MKRPFGPARILALVLPLIMIPVVPAASAQGGRSPRAEAHVSRLEAQHAPARKAQSDADTARVAQLQEPEPVELTGVMNTIWGDVGPGHQDLATLPEYLLVDDTGTFWALDLEEKDAAEEGGPMRLDRRRVHLTGFLDPETERVDVTFIELVQPTPGIAEGNSHIFGTHVSGSQKWVTILCRFGDATGVTPAPASFFQNLMTLMDDFWQEVSYDIINLAGSTVVGWYDLPQNRGAYLDDPATHFPGHTANLSELAVDCTAAADADVDFSQYAGINLMFNQDLDCCSWGGGVTLTRDGVTKTWSTTWMATWGWGNHDVLGQEMGHGFGLPHSSGAYAATYDSQWDVMSGGGVCGSSDPDFGCLGVHVNSVYKDALGWIDPSRRYVATSAPDQLVFLERLAQPGPTGFLEAQIPIGGSGTNFYTIESRKFVSYDDEVPGEAVLIHKMDTTLGDRNAQVVDVDAVPNTNPNDAGARWVPGELFDDPANNISVAILEETSTGFWILINPTVADLSITKSDDPDPVAAGTQLTYTLTVDNDGPDTANNVVVTDALPPEVDYVSDTDTCVEGPPGTLTCSLGSLPSGGSSSFDIVVDVPAGLAHSGTTSISNTAGVTSDQFDPDTSNNEVTINTAVISKADVAITSFTASATPTELLIGDSTGVTLTKTVKNFGPSSPVDVDVDVIAAATAGLDVTPTSASQTLFDLAVGSPQDVVEPFTLTCTGPGLQHVTFTNTVTPIDTTDPDPSNNVAEVTVEIECVIQVLIDIKKSNGVNLKSHGVIPVVIYSTEAGEGGLPVSVDARAIDPLSVHFGPADVLLGVDPPGGATEAHGRGHFGGGNLMLHFRTQESGLDAADSEACVKGQIRVGGSWFTFFGCEDIRLVP
jgi:M6 family metalloprotease-like protein/uncharacterized repeat protein (TIGR01451 family)